MKNKLMQIAVGTIFGLLVLIGAAQFLVSGQELKNESSEHSANPNGIVGTWQTSVTPRNCQTGAAVAPPFPGILTFNRGGTLTGTSTNAPSAYGVWESENGSQRYTFSFLFLRYNASGAFIGTQKVRQTVEIIGGRGDRFTSDGAVEIYDVNGNLIGTGCATSTGTRFE
jgi:hypothetical protein